MLKVYTDSWLEKVGPKVHWLRLPWLDLTITFLSSRVMADPDSEPYDMIQARGPHSRVLFDWKVKLPVSVFVAVH